MLTFFDGQKPMNRRELLRVGTLGLGGLSLSSLLGVKALAKGQPNPLTGKSVIFLFQQGGPSQHETFDPKPDAPSGVRSVGEVIPTSIPGIYFNGWMPRLAKLADKFTVVRSFNTENSGQVGALDEIKQQAAEVLLGGGFDGDRVIGQSDRMGGVPVTDAFKPRNLISTILRSVIDLGQLRLLPNVPMEVTELPDHPPITGLG